MMTSVFATTARRVRSAEEPEWMVWALVGLMLLAGLGLRLFTEGRTQAFSGDGISLSYPAGWAPLVRNDPLQLLSVGDGLATGVFPTQLSLRQMPATEVGRNLHEPSDLALAWSADQSQQLPSYTVLGMQSVTVGGVPAVEVDYAYVASPVLGGSTSIPVVARAQDVLLVQGETVTVLTFAGEQGAYLASAITWDRIRSSLRIGGK
jgi:hypothetical protein